ncbi:Gfo/Idh/MocA family oxidoreductase [Lawsonibacter sp. OA9]|uniref:Gfo/Idh/MocA family protein n=1 Tax=Oscillospiraceae TaxID=216572 RepID=UPI001F0663DD|nr:MULTISPECIES: Gfo/Idh/MocA family oxidoreductase [Oscillospiraceae]MCH1978204.1 Gfo/Idh/MocA family oxidoreductase [Lawsonibacter sp. OA9]MCH1982362.1 Gfo/Idh/MocA family oxidoreductase [Ruminococcus sp. OA3]
MKLNYGMIGGGNGAFIGDVHRRGAFLGGYADLTCGCFTRNPEKNREAAEQWGVPDKTRVYANYVEMAEGEAEREDGIDFVSVTTPNDTHYVIAKTFLEHGIHVICDKPVTSTVEQAKDLQRIARERNLCFGVTYSYFGYAMVHQAREIIDSGKIGEIVYVTTEYPQDWLLLNLRDEEARKKMWRIDPERANGSLCTVDIGTHLEALLHAATGLEIRKVLARFDYTVDGLPLETNSNVMLQLSNGASGSLWSSIVAVGHDADVRIRIYGTEGSLEWYHGKAGLLKLARLGEPVQYLTMNRDYNAGESLSMSHLPAGHPEGYYEAFGNIYELFCKDVIARKNGASGRQYTYPDIEYGIQGVRFVDACLESNANGNVWVEL